ncbi:MAG: pyruvate, phosphate dikinase [Candidatus Thiodiazotropha sp. (ex Ctena orbiculata)]|uniref:Pyruvate, phosphate dikinase n=1 Tax=Candidatus Thiodiazotropha taylori TaxID=2792791 RepID=A0A944QVS3_9GAMM|nr:pyruvate, phosphate dikinase [Candidatus Thiodiazotropha taylori]PUB82973.1 MAG: pyruvate, phosphate dikinase [gamma proteobacterium symbiont of Ctena orbiculata]MBT2990320.1 pyruvate, phosphate dikinase [Candidatus Thiodiazotropha taylori]MBT2998248.1 pyruvate, phosphate dikinase [Candidatus Thiodiazotropha taylori]MBT3002546.1 pyruvate, phosphate dikinase [Candidatus Thiodiazotropha taylori]
MSEKRHVYAFHEGDGKDKKLLGGKGANLCEMTQFGLNVPPGFVISTEACLDYLADDAKTLPASLIEDVHQHMAQVESATGKGFGDADNPLLVSVRSGSAMSMPGMMDTILNLGLNSNTLQGVIEQTGDSRFGYDAYRRFIQLFGKVALGVPDEAFDQEFEAVKQNAHVTEDVGLSANDLQEICERFLKVFEKHTGRPFPEDPYDQLEIAIKAVFGSWMGKRAVDYRRQFNITPDMANGTAVNVCTMVFGNRGNDSATGVAFTRNPGTGENKLFGEYLVNAQGEDVVAGIRTPKPIARLADEMPEMAEQLEELRQKLESHYKEIQDFEFTIERGTLYCLQTRNGKMNATAMVRTSVEMVEEELISKEQALLRIDPAYLEQMLYPRLSNENKVEPIAQGLPASPGAASGLAVFDADRAELMGKDQGQKVILVREETKPEDIHGFFASEGILTSRGGKTSHAAVVARGMGKPCVAGAEGISVDVQRREAIARGTAIREGDMITIDGSSGNVFLGQIPMVEPDFTEELNRLLRWADEAAYLRVMANADTAIDATRALKYGAMGIGLCRTERMFNAVDRLPVVIEMIVAETPEQREAALDKLLPMQRSDFKEILEVMAPKPVTIRLLDPPIHEFLPSEQQLLSDLDELHHLRNSVRGMNVLAGSMMLLQDPEHAKQEADSLRHMVDESLVEQAIEKKETMLRKVRALTETNPMLGHRGVRLGITFPEIYSMQIRAILEAAAECAAKDLEVHPQMMVPQVCTAQELRRVKAMVDEIRTEVEERYGHKINFRFGTMIEVVRACMRADRLVDEAEFFSFGTNDLTQATFSFSREDAENKFLPMYNQNDILKDNPFEVLDEKGVGKLMQLAVEWGRGVKPDLSVGICGEHGGHPSSIAFCHKAGLNYVSCSAPRVPVARLAAAHASLKQQ